MATATKPPTYHLCSYQVRTGEQKYTVYELRQNLTQQAYTREVLEFCLQTQGRDLDEIPARLEEIEREGFRQWAYDDRIYEDPWVQDVTEAEYRVLKKYLGCRRTPRRTAKQSRRERGCWVFSPLPVSFPIQP